MIFLGNPLSGILLYRDQVTLQAIGGDGVGLKSA